MPGGILASAGTGEGLVAGYLVAGRYRLDEVIGRGGMATVWRGHDERLGRDVAVKVCPPATTDCPRTIREERFSSTLLHPNVVSIFDAGDIADDASGACGSFIVMEYVEGTTAHEIAPVPWRAALSIVRQAAEGLAAAHQRGIVHCDVKPGNLLIDRRNRVLVADFGIAMSAESDVGDFVHGSPAYIAPERLTGVPADPRVDVYGLGGVLTFLLTGQRPVGEIINLPIGCPSELASVIARARARNPRERFADARELRAALDAAAGAAAGKRVDDVTVLANQSADLQSNDRTRRASTIESSRLIIGHPLHVRPAQPRQIAQETAAMSPSPVRLTRPVNGARPRRQTYRPHHRSSGPIVAAAILGLLLLLASGIVLRQVVSIAPVVPGPPAAAAAIEMPNVQGETLAGAIESLSERGIVVERVDVIFGPGPLNQVVTQNPDPGATIGDDDLVTLVVRTGR
ncbi:MAG: serine/threonine protein kinase [Chloroflexota bacterium]|nr:serine/threonine protein kinase [Chloroflexota bacterium]